MRFLVIFLSLENYSYVCSWDFILCLGRYVVVVQSISCVWLFTTPWTVACWSPPSSTVRVCSDSWPLSRWCSLTISCSVAPFFFCLHSFSASGDLHLAKSQLNSMQMAEFFLSVAPSSLVISPIISNCLVLPQTPSVFLACSLDSLPPLHSAVWGLSPGTKLGDGRAHLVCFLLFTVKFSPLSSVWK